MPLAVIGGRAVNAYGISRQTGDLDLLVPGTDKEAWSALIEKDSDILNLPDAPDFISQPPAYSLADMIQLCEKMLPYWNTLRYSQPEPNFVGEAFVLKDSLSTEPPAGARGFPRVVCIAPATANHPGYPTGGRCAGAFLTWTNPGPEPYISSCDEMTEGR